MKKAWSVLLVFVFIIILLGATAVGVGYLTGADLQQVYDTLQKTPMAMFVSTLMNYWDAAWAWLQQLPSYFF